MSYTQPERGDREAQAMDDGSQVVASTPDGSVILDLIPCDPAPHGPLIRAWSHDNFAALMERTVGWDEERNQEEPRVPERYRMVQGRNELIGCLAVREEGDTLYLQTIQLVPTRRGRGYGTTLLHHVERIARARGLRRVRLRVYKENPAYHWYRRNGYRVTQVERHSLIMERDV